MAILSATWGITGLAGVTPNFLLIDTNDSIATVTTAGYLNNLHGEGMSLSNKMMAMVVTVAAGVPSANWYQVLVSGSVPSLSYSLVAV